MLKHARPAIPSCRPVTFSPNTLQSDCNVASSVLVASCVLAPGDGQLFQHHGRPHIRPRLDRPQMILDGSKSPIANHQSQAFNERNQLLQAIPHFRAE